MTGKDNRRIVQKHRRNFICFACICCYNMKRTRNSSERFPKYLAESEWGKSKSIFYHPVCWQTAADQKRFSTKLTEVPYDKRKSDLKKGQKIYPAVCHDDSGSCLSDYQQLHAHARTCYRV